MSWLFSVTCMCETLIRSARIQSYRESKILDILKNGKKKYKLGKWNFKIHLVHNFFSTYITMKNVTEKTNFSVRGIHDCGPVNSWSTHHSRYGKVRHVICYIILYSRERLHCGGNRFPIQLYYKSYVLLSSSWYTYSVPAKY